MGKPCKRFLKLRINKAKYNREDRFTGCRSSDFE